MGRYDGEDYAEVAPCREGMHTHEMNGCCHVCRIRTTSDGFSLAEHERRTLRAENQRLQEALTKARAEGDERE